MRIERCDPLPGVEGGEVRHPAIDAAGLWAVLERLGKAHSTVGRVHRKTLHIGFAQTADRVASPLELRVAAFLPVNGESRRRE